MDAFDEIQALPKGKTLLSAIGNTSLNCLGGIIAGRVRGILADQLPAVKGAGTIGIFAIATAMHYYARSGKGWDGVIKEIAGGMGGFVGNDMWLIARAFVGWGKWKKETDYKAGDIVIHENKYYKAEKDIPKAAGAEPGKDSRWVRFETAQGFDPDEITGFAQALYGNDALLDGLVKEQLLIFGPELAQCVGRELNQAEANNIYSGMRDSLKSVVQRMAQA